MIPAPQTIALTLRDDVRRYDATRPRSLQSAQGRLGPSDLGFCRMKALLTMQEVPDSDEDDTWQATLGSLIGDGVEVAIKDAHPGWIVGAVDGRRFDYTFHNGASIGGTPDLVIPEWNAVLDDKTKDGLSLVRRDPWTQNYRYQVWTYVAACVAAGVLDGTKPLWMGLVYWDRAGKESTPHVVFEEWNPGLEDEIVSWIDDVIYAHVHGEEASRDIPAPVCEQICGKFTICRGALPDSHEPELIEDDYLVKVIQAYVDGRAMETDGKKLKEAAARELDGVNGIGGGWQVRWTYVPPTEVPGYERRGYDKIDVRKARSRA